MVFDLTTLLIVVKTTILLLGAVITYFASKAYLRTRDRSLGLLATGFALVTVGAALGGLIHELIGTDLIIGVLIEGLFILTGFAVIAYSLRI